MTTEVQAEERVSLRQRISNSRLGFHSTSGMRKFIRQMLPSAAKSAGYIAIGFTATAAFQIGKGEEPVRLILLGLAIVIGMFLLLTGVLYILARILDHRDWKEIEAELTETYGPRGEDGVRRKD